jgi:hypothetical protein
MLVPDILLRTTKYSEERWLLAPRAQSAASDHTTPAKSETGTPTQEGAAAAKH